MPHKKITIDPLTRVIRAYMDTAQLAEVLEISRPTAIMRMNAPGTLTVEELRKLNKKGHIPINDLREGI